MRSPIPTGRWMVFIPVKKRSQPHRVSKKQTVRFAVHRIGEYRSANIVIPLQVLRYMGLLDDGAAVVVLVGRLQHAGQVLIRRAEPGEEGYLLSTSGGNRVREREIKLSGAFFDIDDWHVPVMRVADCTVLECTRDALRILLPKAARPPVVDNIAEHRRAAV